MRGSRPPAGPCTGATSMGGAPLGGGAWRGSRPPAGPCTVTVQWLGGVQGSAVASWSSEITGAGCLGRGMHMEISTLLGPSGC